MDAICMLTEDDEFVPNRRQLGFKILLHRRTPPSVLAKLTPPALHTISAYIAPYELSEVVRWVTLDPAFYEWMLAVDSEEVILHEARQRAAKTIVETLDLPDIDETGKVNTKLRALKMKAATEVLKGRSTQNSTTNQNVNIKTTAQIPKRLANLSLEDLERKYAMLQEANQ